MERYESLQHSKWECKYHCVSTVGLDEETIREYARSQEGADKKLDQLKIFE